MVVVTLSGVPSVGGSVTWGSTGWILAVTKTSLTSEVMMELLPTPSSPQTQIRTGVPTALVNSHATAGQPATSSYSYPAGSDRGSTYRLPYFSMSTAHCISIRPRWIYQVGLEM